MTGRQRFRFALGVRVRLRGGRLCSDDRGTRVVVQRQWRFIEAARFDRQRSLEDVYWLDRPIAGLSYFHGDDLEHMQRRVAR